MQEQDLLPHNWFGLQGFEETILGLRDCTFAQHETLEDIHYEQLFFILDGVIKAVTDEQKFEQGSYTDHIDDLFAEKTQRKGTGLALIVEHLWRKVKDTVTIHTIIFIYKAQERLQKNQSQQKIQAKCRKLKSAIPVVENYLNESGRYAHVQPNHPDKPPLVRIADPLFTNLNSCQSLTLLLRKLGTDAGIERCGGNQRKWLIVCCDGLPYHMLINIIKETWTCAVCQSSFVGRIR